MSNKQNPDSVEGIFDTEPLHAAVQRAFARTTSGIKPGLQRIERLLAELNLDPRQLTVIHVAGTNGKGSVCAGLSAIFSQVGLRVGCYTSPHLVKFNERFRINDQDISDTDLRDQLIEIEKAAEQIEKVDPALSPSFFEISTAVAFRYFIEEKVELAIIETGMGGRWDATNVVMPILSVITRVAVDHTNYLGTSLDAIASEKAGIIKRGRPVVIADQTESVLRILEEVARTTESPILFAQERVAIQRQKVDLNRGQKVKVEFSSGDSLLVNYPLHGRHQLENLSVIMGVTDVLRHELKLPLPVDDVKKGLSQLRWAARGAVLGVNPLTVLDGAHNPSGAKALGLLLKELDRASKWILVCGFLQDKDVEAILSILKPRIREIWIAPLVSPRGMTMTDLQRIGRQVGLTVHESGTVVEAALKARDRALEEQCGLCIAGSLYLVGEIVERINSKELSFWNTDD